jgi:hypothetical protein
VFEELRMLMEGGELDLFVLQAGVVFVMAASLVPPVGNG